jgi:hypothetical protein
MPKPTRPLPQPPGTRAGTPRRRTAAPPAAKTIEPADPGTLDDWAGVIMQRPAGAADPPSPRGVLVAEALTHLHAADDQCKRGGDVALAAVHAQIATAYAALAALEIHP